LLRDVQTFVASLDTMFGGFRERAEQTYALLKRPETAFVVVATPELDALREASYFVERLGADAMPLAGLVLNRMHQGGPDGLSEHQSTAAADRLDGSREHRLTASLLRLHSANLRLAARDAHRAARLTAAHPTVPVARAPAMSIDVNDLGGLRQIAAELATRR
jgi:anion-transporting  ArsA/GET3 family ATPase